MWHCIRLVMVVASINIVSSLAEDISKPAVVQSNYSYDITLPCVYAPGLTVGDRRREMECCTQAIDHYNKWWTMGEAYLTRLLENLQGWNCPQFQYECANRTRAFTPFAKLAYARFCNQSELLDRCQDRISTPENIAMLRSTNSSSLEMWVQLAKNMSMDNYEDPCVQIALYEHGGYSNYQETVEPIIPFCDMAMCGFDLATLTENNFNTWSCMPASCRANIIIAMVVVAIVGILVIVSNVTVLYVLINYPKLRNSQALYKLSLAFADLLVGIVVFPTCLVSTSKLFMGSHVVGDVVPVQGFNTSLGDLANFSGDHLSTVLVRNVGRKFVVNFPQSYFSFVGFVTTVSLLVSVYTLMLASVDRLWAVLFPFHFHRGNAKTVAKYNIAVLWAVAILFGLIPFIVPGMKYGLVASILVSFGGRSTLILYSVSFVTPLVLVWVTSLATYCTARKHSVIRRKMTRLKASKKVDKMEGRLVKTLSVMVLVFSMSLVPAAVVLLVPLFVSNIYYLIPERLNPTAAKIYNSVEYVTIIILLTNSLWNCIIYSLRNREFASQAKKLYLRSWMSKGESSSSKSRNQSRSPATISTNTKRPSTGSVLNSRRDSPLVLVKYKHNLNSESREESASKIDESCGEINSPEGQGMGGMSKNDTGTDTTSRIKPDITEDSRV